jgi:ribosome-binding protein aMBF1 (putative translation factor)
MAKTKIGRPYTSRTIQKMLKRYIAEDMKKMEKRMMIATRVKAALDALGLNPKDLALRLGKRPGDIKKLLNAQQDFQADLLIKIEKVLGTKILDQ